jgi:hypothetical protein
MTIDKPEWKFWQSMRLRSRKDEVNEKQRTPKLRRAVAAAVDMGRWRMISVFDPDEDGAPIRESHRFLFQVAGKEEWVTLFDVSHEALSLSDRQLDNELETTIQQNMTGGGPSNHDPVPPLPSEVAPLN